MRMDVCFINITARRWLPYNKVALRLECGHEVVFDRSLSRYCGDIKQQEN